MPCPIFTCPQLIPPRFLKTWFAFTPRFSRQNRLVVAWEKEFDLVI
jgi:hypothetical protein